MLVLETDIGTNDTTDAYKKQCILLAAELQLQ